MFTKIDKIVPRLINKYNLQGGMKAAQIVTIWPEVLEKVFGNKEVLECTKAQHLKDKVLTIRVTNNIIAQEIQLQKNVIMQKLNGHYEEERVKDIRFKVG